MPEENKAKAADEFLVPTDPALDYAKLAESIRQQLAKMPDQAPAGLFPDNLPAAAPPDLADERAYFAYLLANLERAWDLDLTTPPPGLFRRLLWRLLRPYTYRMFSRQRAFNALVAGALAHLSKKGSDLFLPPRSDGKKGSDPFLPD